MNKVLLLYLKSLLCDGIVVLGCARWIPWEVDSCVLACVCCSVSFPSIKCPPLAFISDIFSLLKWHSRFHSSSVWNYHVNSSMHVFELCSAGGVWASQFK